MTPLSQVACSGCACVLCAYQHAWNPKDMSILAKREELWYKMSHSIGSIPYQEHLIVGGDLNVQLTPLRPHVGHGTGALSQERAPDADAVHTMLSTHSLVALNTWGVPGRKAHTFVFGKRQAQLDYVMVRQRHSDGEARVAHPVQDCPVGGRHGGGIHKPVAASLPFHYKVFHKPPASMQMSLRSSPRTLNAMPIPEWLSSDKRLRKKSRRLPPCLMRVDSPCLSEKSLPSTSLRHRRGQNQWLDGSNRK